MSNFKDRTNVKYGKLTAIEYLGDSKWRCLCDCGNEKIVYGGHLEDGHTKSCGCIRPPRTNLYGQTFGRLTVLDWEGNGKWRCRCECGNEILVKTDNLKSGNTKSCGCLQKDRASETSFQSLVGQRYGRLVVLERVDNNRFGHVCYNCKCDCGNETIVDAANLRNGNTTSCGCYKKEVTQENNTIDLLGQRFGKLLVLEKTEIRNNGSVYWKCQCDCGNVKNINGSNLRQGYTRSCGCKTMSLGEEKIINILKENEIPFIYDNSYFNDVDVGKGWNGRFDFVLYPNTPNIRLIEFDGEQHFKEWTLGNETLLQRKARDEIKNQYAKSHNIPLVRIPYWERDNITLEMLLSDQYLIKEIGENNESIPEEKEESI